VNFEVLLARIDANIRRYKEQSAQSRRRKSTLRKFKSLSIDTLRRRVIQEDKEVCLSTIEYSLLLFLSEHPDTLLLYSDLYNHVWGSDSYGDFRTVMVHISNLRKKIDSAHSGIIETVRGAGYIFCDV
jgi:DNA-binding response OmpR family regulator